MDVHPFFADGVSVQPFPYLKKRLLEIAFSSGLIQIHRLSRHVRVIQVRVFSPKFPVNLRHLLPVLREPYRLVALRCDIDNLFVLDSIILPQTNKMGSAGIEPASREVNSVALLALHGLYNAVRGIPTGSSLLQLPSPFRVRDIECLSYEPTCIRVRIVKEWVVPVLPRFLLGKSQMLRLESLQPKKKRTGSGGHNPHRSQSFCGLFCSGGGCHSEPICIRAAYILRYYLPAAFAYPLG